MNTESRSLRQIFLPLVVALLAAAVCMGISLQAVYADSTTLPDPVDGQWSKTITLTENVNLQDTAVLEGSYDLDLAGYTITGPSGDGSTAIRVTGESSSLTLKDSSEDQSGKIISNGGYSKAIEVDGNSASVIIFGGTIVVNGDWCQGIYVNGNGFATMRGGSIEAKGSSAMGINVAQGKVTLFKNITGSITASGSGAIGINLSGSGNKADIRGGSITVNGDGSGYGIQASLSEDGDGHDVRVSGGTISVTGSRTYAVYMDGGSNLTISGGVLTSENSAAVGLIQSGNSATITGGTIKGATYGVLMANVNATTLSISEAALSGITGSNGKVNGTLIKDSIGAYTVIPQGSGYVLMNIPYGDFYAAELDEDAAPVDVVTSATKMKPRTGTLAGGSYHVNSGGTDISGVIYPVFVSDMSALEDKTQITDESSVEITVTNRGQTTTTTYSGKDALFESTDYSYYVLSEAPVSYKTLTVGGDGSFSFSTVSAEATEVEGAAGIVTVGARHADVEISLSGTTGIEQGQAVSGIVLTDADGHKYALRHIANIWRATEIGWNFGEFDLAGKTITNVRYYTQDAVIDYPAEIEIGSFGYVVMNIPYTDFYAGEGNTSAIDAVSSATQKKYMDATRVGGSYYDAEEKTINGASYPVFVADKSRLDTAKQVASDGLAGSGDYAYYELTTKPAVSKKLTFAEDGSMTFAAISARATTKEDVTAKIGYGKSHTQIEVELKKTGLDEQEVSGVILVSGENSYYLRHLANIYESVEFGWNLDEFDLAGKTIDKVRYITPTGIFDFPIALQVDTYQEMIEEITAELDNLQSKVEEAQAALEALPENATEDQKKKAEKALNKAIKKLEAAKATIEKAKELDAAAHTGGGSTPSDAAQAKAALNTAITDAKSIAADGYTADSYKALTDAIAAAEKVAADPNATAEQLKAATEAIAAAKAGLVQAADDSEYTVTAEATDAAAGTAALTNPKDAAKYNIPKTVVLADGKTYKVTAIGAGAFTGKQTKKVVVGANVDTIEQGAFDQSGVTKLIVKTKKLTKASVAGSLTGSSVKVIKVKVGKKKVNKKFVRKYRKIFTVANAGQKAKVK